MTQKDYEKRKRYTQVFSGIKISGKILDQIESIFRNNG